MNSINSEKAASWDGITAKDVLLCEIYKQRKAGSWDGIKAKDILLREVYKQRKADPWDGTLETVGFIL